MINTENETNCIVGGDFNMDKVQLNKKIVERNMNMRRIEMEGNPATFHRWDNVNRNMQSSTIDHVMISNGEVGGAKVSETGLDLNDHSIIIGWLKAEKGIVMRKEMKGVKRPTFSPRTREQRRGLKKHGAGYTTAE